MRALDWRAFAATNVRVLRSSDGSTQRERRRRVKVDRFCTGLVRSYVTALVQKTWFGKESKHSSAQLLVQSCREVLDGRPGCHLLFVTCGLQALC